MRFEKITENKIRITFNIEDLEKDNIDFHSFMSNSIESQSVFLDMLSKAEKEIGFITNNYQLTVEALATSNGHFVVTVTRMLPEPAKVSSNINTLYPGAPQPSKRKLSAKRKAISATMPIVVFQFEDFDDFCNLSNCLNKDILKRINKIFTRSILYLYNSSYYLTLKTNETSTLSDLKHALSTISEFSTAVRYSTIFEKKLTEYGKVILPNNCFLKINKFFAN
ncbi:MAG: adaptor protein MecA [Oscillospiraceae bacterium]|nr:adaptor protein MecA [Oscillospiraceae bacterium]